MAKCLRFKWKKQISSNFPRCVDHNYFDKPLLNYFEIFVIFLIKCHGKNWKKCLYIYKEKKSQKKKIPVRFQDEPITSIKIFLQGNVWFLITQHPEMFNVFCSVTARTEKMTLCSLELQDDLCVEVFFFL